MAASKQLYWFLGIAFVFSWLCWIPAALVAQGMAVSSRAEQFIDLAARNGAWGPLLGAIIATAIASGKAGLADLWQRVIRFRIGGFWYLVVLGLFPVLVGGSFAIALMTGDPIPELPAFAEPATLPIAFVFILLLGGPLQEELGWRGLLQQKLQDRYSALTSSLLVGMTWGIWHLPLFFVPREEFYYNRPIWGLVLTTVLISVVFGWVYNNTRNSLWAVLLLHTSFNWSHYLFPALGSDTAGLLLFILQGLFIVFIVARYGGQTLRRTNSSQ